MELVAIAPYNLLYFVFYKICLGGCLINLTVITDVTKACSFYIINELLGLRTRHVSCTHTHKKKNTRHLIAGRFMTVHSLKSRNTAGNWNKYNERLNKRIKSHWCESTGKNPQ